MLFYSQTTKSRSGEFLRIAPQAINIIMSSQMIVKLTISNSFCNSSSFVKSQIIYLVYIVTPYYLICMPNTRLLHLTSQKSPIRIDYFLR